MTVFKATLASLLILGFAALIIFLLNESGVTQTRWERYVYLLSGVEAIVFTAVGWIYGKEVHREQAQKAEAKADDATSKHVVAAADAAAAREKGENLARAIILHTNDTPVTPRTADVRAEPAGTDLAALARLAAASYPDLRRGPV